MRHFNFRPSPEDLHAMGQKTRFSKPAAEEYMQLNYPFINIVFEKSIMLLGEGNYTPLIRQLDVSHNDKQMIKRHITNVSNGPWVINCNPLLLED